MSDMTYTPDFTPRSSPGRVPTADIEQYFLGDELTRLASFISGAPPDLLHDIMSAATEQDLRARLTNFSPLDTRIQPRTTMKDYCARLTRWLESSNQFFAISKDVVPYALILLLKVRVVSRRTDHLHRYNQSTRLGVAVKIAYGNLCDGTIWPETLESLLDMLFEDIQEAELEFLKDLDWRTWVREDEFKEFFGRFKIVWDVLLDYDDKTV